MCCFHKNQHWYLIHSPALPKLTSNGVSGCLISRAGGPSPWLDLNGCLCSEPDGASIPIPGPVCRGQRVRREADGVMDTLMQTPEAAATLPHPITSHFPLVSPANLWPEVGGQGGQSKPLPLLGGCHPSRPQAWPLSLEAAQLLDSVGKDDVSVEGSLQEQGDSGLSPESN